MPSLASSQAVSRAPWRTGRVSSTHTKGRLPASTAPPHDPERGAVPGGRQPAGVAVGEDARALGHEGAPRGRRVGGCSRCLPRGSPPASAARLARRAAIDAARCAAACRRIRSSAQKRLTAVGRVAARPWLARLQVAEEVLRPRSPRLARPARTTPNAAVTPMAGAPRTASERIASATSSHVRHSRYVSSPGSRRWSSRSDVVAQPGDRRERELRETPLGASAARRARASSGETPATSTSLVRAPCPRRMVTAERGQSSASARRARTASLAAPPAGGAVTRTRSEPPAGGDDLVPRRAGLDLHGQPGLALRSALPPGGRGRSTRHRRASAPRAARASAACSGAVRRAAA